MAVLNSHPAIEASVVVGLGSSSADRRLVAYAVPAGAETPSGEQLGEFLSEFLPDYLVPAQYVWLDELPVTAHGKIDRDALPAPAPATTAATAPSTAPAAPTAPTGASEIEATTAAVVAELLDVEAVDPHQNFFLLGGHSMLGAQLIVRLEDLFGVEISLRYLFDHPTPGEIAAEVERQTAAGQPAGMVPG